MLPHKSTRNNNNYARNEKSPFELVATKVQENLHMKQLLPLSLAISHNLKVKSYCWRHHMIWAQALDELTCKLPPKN